MIARNLTYLKVDVERHREENDEQDDASGIPPPAPRQALDAHAPAEILILLRIIETGFVREPPVFSTRTREEEAHLSKEFPRI